MQQVEVGVSASPTLSVGELRAPFAGVIPKPSTFQNVGGSAGDQ